MILANQFVSTAFFAGKDKYEELYRTNKAMTEWIGRNMEKLCISSVEAKGIRRGIDTNS